MQPKFFNKNYFCNFILPNGSFCSRETLKDEWRCFIHDGLLNTHDHNSNNSSQNVFFNKMLFLNGENYIDLNTCDVFKDKDCLEYLGKIDVYENIYFLL